MNLKLSLIALVLTALCFDCHADMRAPEIFQKQQECRNAANDALGDLYKLNPAARQRVRQAAAYIAVENISPKIIIVGGGSGKGIAVNNKTGKVTYMQLTDSLEEVSFGLKQYAAVFVFESEKAYNKFLEKPRQLSDQAARLRPAASGPYAGAFAIAPGVWLYQIANDKFIATLNTKSPVFSKYDDLNRGLR
jgi:hypothetical protein